MSFPTGGFPWAFVVSLVVLAFVELGVRQLPVCSLIPYRSDETQYEAVADYLDLSGPADVCIVGSSRAREAVIPEEVAMLCDQEGASALRVANYSCPGARAEENEAIIKFLLRRGRPRMIVYGVSPRQLLDRERPYDQVALFEDWADWKACYRRDHNLAIDLLPVVVRAHIGRFYRTLRYRRRPGVIFSDLLLALRYDKLGGLSFSDFLTGRAFPCPIRGERSRWHWIHTNVSLVSRPISLKRVHQYVERLRWRGAFVMRGRQREHLQGLLRACKNAGVQLVLVEVPLSDMILQCYPTGLYGGFIDEMRSLADRFEVPFVTARRLGLRMADSEFLDQTHLNYSGALHFTHALVHRVIMPNLRSG